MLGMGGSARAPEDPALARLLPDAYRDDPDAAGEFRRFTEQSLRSAKQESARIVLDTLPADGGPVKLSGEQAQSWLRALNDVRLALGVRLGVTEEFEEQWQELDPVDPRSAAFEVYAWLGGVQESHVAARGVPGTLALCSRSAVSSTTRSSLTPAPTTRTRHAA
jgi:hypothetical protein